MKLILWSITFLFPANLALSKSYGEARTLKSPITLQEALKKADGKTESLVKAKVGKVCQKKGCWLSLEDPQDKVRVTFKDYSFFVPMDLVGQTVLVQGFLSLKDMSEKDAKHYAEDEGKDPSKIKGPQREYQMKASSVETIN